MGKDTFKRLVKIANNAEAIARHQGLSQGRRESDAEIERISMINRKLLRSLKDMVEWGEVAGLAEAILYEPRKTIRMAEGKDDK